MASKNSLFKFKQFSISQVQSAMKVGTDGVLLGAWAPIEDAKTVLDIGTGTGLIALMMAQRNPILEVTALEIDAGAHSDAKENFVNSPWDSRLNLIHGSFQNFSSKPNGQFDAIVCNPPFFSDGCHAPKSQRAVARHTIALSNKDLLKGAFDLLKEDGTLSVILPFLNFDSFCQEAKKTLLNERERLIVYPTPHKSAVRVLSVWTKKKVEKVIKTELIIEENGRHNYSKEYKELTKEFYLKF